MRFYLLLFAVLLLIGGCMPRAGRETAGYGPDVRVLIASIADQDTLYFTGDYRLRSEEAAYEFGPRNRTVVIRRLSDGLQIYNQNRNLLYRNPHPVILEPAGTESRFTFHGTTYAGAVILQSSGGGTVFLINRINIEAYLKGVVPAEIPAIRESDFQAMKLIAYLSTDAAQEAIITTNLGFVPAMAITTTLSTLHHIGHPKSETWGAVLGGVIFSSIALVTRSILYPICIHAMIGVVNDTFIYLRSHRGKAGG